jgi:formate-dependent nitrite reductase membrane component NrfD
MAKSKIREWMTIHKWMTDYTPQTEWIEKRGIMVWVAEVFTSVGSGLYLVSLFFSLASGYEKFAWWGILIAWFVIMFLKIPLHLAYFGKPFRFWRTIPPFSNGWKTSWFARGIIFNILFGSFVFLQLITSYLLVNPIQGLELNVKWEYLPLLDGIFKTLGGLTAVVVGLYSGFIMNFVKGIPFWNSAMLPLVLMIGGVLDGFAILMGLAIDPSFVKVDKHLIELLSSAILVLNIFLIALYLLSAVYVGSAAKVSAEKLLKGNLAIVFWVCLIFLGLLVPLVISIPALIPGGKSLGAEALIFAIICHAVGAFALKYCILKVGIYRPLFVVSVS